MENPDKDQTKEKKKMSKKIIIPIILVILILLSFSGLLLYSNITKKPIAQIVRSFAPKEKEHTVQLEEFLVNLKSQYGDSKQYLRINITLMYTDSKQTENIQANISLIRDLIISSLRDVTIENALQEETMINFKQKAIENINENLGQDLIKELYITDMIVR